MKIFLVIPSYNGDQDTLECLESVLQSDQKSFELSVVIVDNCSTNNSLKKIKNYLRSFANNSRHSRVKVIENRENLGFSGGNNVGIRYALENEADWVFLLNNDTKIKNDCLIQLIKVAKSDKKIGLLGPKIYFYPGCEFHQSRYQENEKGKIIWYAGGIIDWQNVLGTHRGVDKVDTGQYNQVSATEFVSGCAMMVKREVFERVSLFDERYFLYYEDVDFNLRAKQAGYKLIFVPQAIIWHKNRGTGQTGLPHQEYYMARNRLLFASRWAPTKTKIALVKESLMSLFKGSKAKKKGIIDYYLRKFGKGPY